jgi:hypothetical protein
MIKDQGTGLPTVAVCRKHALSTAAFCKLDIRKNLGTI